MDQRVQVSIVIVESEFRHSPNISELAAGVGLSSSRFRHLFKAATGKTLAQYVTKVRMREAGILLADTHLSVKEIMNLVGMTDASRFARIFRNAYGLSASCYRDQHPSGLP